MFYGLVPNQFKRKYILLYIFVYEKNRATAFNRNACWHSIFKLKIFFHILILFLNTKYLVVMPGGGRYIVTCARSIYISITPVGDWSWDGLPPHWSARRPHSHPSPAGPSHLLVKKRISRALIASSPLTEWDPPGRWRLCYIPSHSENLSSFLRHMTNHLCADPFVIITFSSVVL